MPSCNIISSYIHLMIDWHWFLTCFFISCLYIMNIKHNAIIMYIIIILIIVILKPNFIYDHANNQYRELKYKKNKTISILIVIGILMAASAFIFVVCFSRVA